MLELYKGQLTFDEIKHDMPYKEALMLREVRIERLKAEREQIESERKAEEQRHQNAMPK
jgi:hypothetical protein